MLEVRFYFRRGFEAVRPFGVHESKTRANVCRSRQSQVLFSGQEQHVSFHHVFSILSTPGSLARDIFDSECRPVPVRVSWLRVFSQSRDEHSGKDQQGDRDRIWVARLCRWSRQDPSAPGSSCAIAVEGAAILQDPRCSLPSASVLDVEEIEVESVLS
jgi:hypothetical protein